MRKYLIKLLLLLMLQALPATALAITGYYSDPGGGSYWCNVYVHDIAASKSYGWCTGDSEDGKMNEFRGFECSNDGKVTTGNPWIFFKFRYNKTQSKDYDYKSSNQQVYVMLQGGTLHKILDAGSSWSQTDKSWGLVNCSWDGEWFYVRFAPNERGLREVAAIQVESDSYFYQSNFWHRDYWFYIHARYLKGINFDDMSRAREAQVEWIAPGKVKVSADNSWLPSQIGNGVTDFSFTTAYSASVYVPSTGKTYSSATFSAKNRGNGSVELSVPLDRDFTVNVTRNTQTNFTFEVGGNVNQSLNEGATQSTSFVNGINKIAASFNQVDGTTTITWEDSYPSGQGEYQVYRTLLDEHGSYEGNREIIGTTQNKNFTDNASHGLDYGKNYRYEVFMKRNSWGDITIPSNPETLTVVKAAEARVSTMPVIPLHLVQDSTDTDNVKMDWIFGNVPKSENDITFKVHRIEPSGTITRNYLNIDVPRDAGKASFKDEKPASICSNYGYFVQLDLASDKVHIYSDTVYAHVTGISRITAVEATKGTAGSDVVIKWKAHHVGTEKTLYDVQRRFIGSDDWLSIHREEGTSTSYSYTDPATEPGRYYEYRVIAYAGDCDGGGHAVSNMMRDVGFCRASGVVSGRVQFDSGTAVGDVRVTLTRESDPTSGQAAHSRSVLDPGDAITITGLSDIVTNDKPFTLQFYIRPDRDKGSMTLTDFPRKLQLDYNSGSGLYDIKMNDAVVGAIPADEFTQVTLISDAANLTTHVAGNPRAVNDPAATPQPLPYIFDREVKFYESGNSFDGWILSQEGGNTGWIINGDNAFQTSHEVITAYKDFLISEPMIGATVTASVTISSPWGARRMNVEANCLNANNNSIATYSICNDLSKHDDWQTFTTEFTIPDGTKAIRYNIIATDGPNWGGHYGPCFKDMTLAMAVSHLSDGNWVLLPDFEGNVDEIRLWNRALAEEEIARDADRIISGESEGLKALITFDEGLEEYAFDSSLTNGVPNGHHVTVGANTRPSDVIPSEEQLSSYGITNNKGEYEIRGIQFTGSGTRYSVAPTKGIHKFSPTSRSAFIGGTSLTINNVDFTDVSSFKVSGTVRYSGTTIPVDSVSFYVDGMPCNKNDKLILTDKNGEYEISVPIGSHYVEVRRTGHSFEGAGRYPVTEGETYEFLEDTHIDFFDSTLVTVAGRVTGGETEGSKPLGYGASENNIGCAVITLTPLDHPQRMLNAIEKVDGTTVEWIANSADVPIPAATTATASEAWRKGGDEDAAKCIQITTDAATGEFSALLPPIRYKVESVKFPKNPTLENDELFMSVPAIDLTHPTDTIIPDTIYSADKVPLPLFKCNRKLLLTYRSQPVMDITQVGVPGGAFGTDTITVRDAGQDIKLAIYDYDEDTRKVTYNYGYPVFQMGRTYNFKIKAYEPYINYDTSTAGKLYKDVLRDSIITFDNEMGSEAMIAAVDTVSDGHSIKRGDMVQLESGQVRLDKNGEGNYKWVAGIPSLTAPFTRNMNASMVINKQTRLWSNDGLTGICFGVVPTGNNFITAGPSHVQMVLRDPPGDASSATWATDSVTSDYTYTVRGTHNGTELGVDIHTSMEFGILTGTICFGKLTYNTVIRENSVTYKYDVNKTWDNHTSVTYTNSQSTSTSSTMDYVGRDGDVFIGYSTNYIIGAADKIGLFKNDKGEWVVDMQETMAMDEKFNTHFEYSQKYIETTLFSNIERTRNSMLKHITSSAEIEENPAKPTYYTFLTGDDPKYGSLNDDKTVWGAQAKDGFDGPSYYARFPDGYEDCDSVRWCNEIITAWKKTLADNEEDKLKAFGDAKYKIGNESFERGSTVNKSTGSTTKEVHNSVEQFSTGIAYKGKNGYLLDKFGGLVISNTEIGYHQTKYDVDETTTSERFSYSLNDTQRGNAHTVDIFNSPHGWGPIFRTRGGQTRCPYEGETKTKYYRPGQTLDYATMKIDNPHISMPIRNFVDIPAGQEARVQIVLANESEVREELSPVFLMVDSKSNPNGLEIFMDGLPLAGGSEVWIQYGVPLVKTLTIKQSDNSVLDYNDITLVISNTCKPAEWFYGTVSFSAHFVPAAPDITLKLNKNILNQRAVQSGEQLKVTISDINRMFTGMKGVRLKYRFAGDTNWVTAHEWLTDEKYYTDGHETDVQSLLPTDRPDITYNLQLPDIDGLYMVAAESICDFGGKDYVSTTAEQQVTRDTRGPKLLGQAYPNTGLLTPSDDIHIRFNEDIRESYLTKDTNFFITGYLNGAKVDNRVSLQLNGNELTTDAYVPISNTSFAANLWLKRTGGGTLLEHGTEGSKINLTLDDDGHVTIGFGDKTITSTEVIPADRWVFLALNYDKNDDRGNTFTMLLADEDRETMLFDGVALPDYDGTGHLSVGRGLHGAMHDLTMWSVSRNVHTALAQKDEVVAAYLPGLVGYWRMDEGHGTTVTDLARSRNFNLDTERWNIENKSLAAHFDGSHDMEIGIGEISPRNTDSYAIEFWFKGEPEKNAGKTMVSVTDKISIGFGADKSLVLNTYDNGEHSSLTTDGTTGILSTTDYSDGQWHHLALNVRRGMSAVVYVDGRPVKTFAEQDIPAPAGDKLYVGSISKRDKEHDQIIAKTGYFTGDIDELRIWNASTDGNTIAGNRYNEVDTATVSGLIAYFPMETERLDGSHNIITEFSTANAAPLRNTGRVGTVNADGITQADSSPALKSAPLRQNLDYEFVANDNEIYITLKTLPARMHGNMITFTVKNVRDMADNLSETVTWSVLADFNTFFWTNNDMELSKSLQESITFSSTLYNFGNENDSYVISGLPTWMTVNHSEGMIGVNSTEELTFKVLESAPLGFHTVQIYVSNAAGIYCDPIILRLMVYGNEPDWDVNPDEFESSMNVIGQVYIKDKICTDTYDRVAAFVGDKCCGVASPELMASRDAYFVDMTIYGDQDITAEQPVTFRVYDASQGVVLNNVATSLDGKPLSVVYRPNALVGDYDKPVKWNATEHIEQWCDLTTGWNWISLYAHPEPGHADLESVLGHAKVFNTIKSKEGFAMNSGTQWTAYGLDTLAVGNLYKVKMKADANVSITGTRIDTRKTTQTIYSGWNWIGPLSIYNLSPGEAFADLNPTRGDIVKSKTQVAIYDGYKWEGKLAAITPGMGYYYKSNNPETVTFRYPTIDESAYRAPLLLPDEPTRSPFTPVDHHLFSDNMNVVARVMDGEARVDTLTVAAFIDGECRGVTTATDNGYYLLTVAGNTEETGQPVSFATIYKGELTALNETLAWGSDVIYGDLDEPVVLTISTSGVNDIDANVDGILITPTLVRDVVNVRAGSLLETVVVYSTGGGRVAQATHIGDNIATVNLSHLHAGIYFVEAITTGGHRAVKHIVKQ